VCEIDDLTKTVFSGLLPLVIDDVTDEGERIVVRARTPEGPVACPGCRALSGRVHGYHQRTLADVPVDARPVVLRVRVRRLVCPTRGCRRTFREQLPGVLNRYQRRTPRLGFQVGAVVRQAAGRAGARLLSALAVVVSRHTALRALLRLALPERRVPRVLGVDDFALCRRRRYATVLIDAVTRQRIDVLPDRKAHTLETWLRAHPGVEVVCRALPQAVQVADRWHLWHNLAEAVRKEVTSHSMCWAAAGLPPQAGIRAATTRQRWQQVHDLLDKGVGLLECARRLNLGLNTVKRYARISEPQRLIRAPQYRPTLVDPYRDHLRRRRQQDPAVGATQLLAEIRELGYTGSLNLLYRYITQGRVEADRPALSPRRLTRYLLTAPDQLTNHQQTLVDALTAACPEMTALAGFIGSFAALLTPTHGNDDRLDTWIAEVKAKDLPHLHSSPVASASTATPSTPP
jgi:hypothetical protein